MSPEPVLPVDEIAKRDLEFFLLADCSSSMSGEKMATLNHVMREVINTDLPSALENQPNVQLNFRVIAFGSDARFSIGPDPVPLEKVTWTDLSANGLTATADAINLLCTQLATERMPKRGLPPVCILISDGMCTQGAEVYEKAINNLESLPWGKKSIRLAIGLGKMGVDLDEDELKKFVMPAFRDEIGVLNAQNKSQLVKMLRWASVSASVASSITKSKMGAPGDPGAHVVMPPPPDDVVEPTDGTDIF
ncbi:tellurium resistance protein [Haloferula chungangensis]|uniref:Tellurium resistance protein n=1 Tax=Haloferula chungangensis TaxID=1048331 RepID=A0ABW2L0X7_9BACT